MFAHPSCPTRGHSPARTREGGAQPWHKSARRSTPPPPRTGTAASTWPPSPTSTRRCPTSRRCQRRSRSSSSELAQRVDTPRGDRSERGKVKVGGPQPAPALVGGVVTVGRRQMCRGVVGGARTRTRGFAPLRQLRGRAVRSSTLFGLWVSVWFHGSGVDHRSVCAEINATRRAQGTSRHTQPRHHKAAFKALSHATEHVWLTSVTPDLCGKKSTHTRGVSGHGVYGVYRRRGGQSAVSEQLSF